MLKLYDFESSRFINSIGTSCFLTLSQYQDSSKIKEDDCFCHNPPQVQSWRLRSWCMKLSQYLIRNMTLNIKLYLNWRYFLKSLPYRDLDEKYKVLVNLSSSGDFSIELLLRKTKQVLLKYHEFEYLDRYLLIAFFYFAFDKSSPSIKLSTETLMKELNNLFMKKSEFQHSTKSNFRIINIDKDFRKIFEKKQ